MSLESWYAILTRLFVWCLALILVSVIFWRMVSMYGDVQQVTEMILIWRWYRWFVAVSVLYVSAMRQMDWSRDRRVKTWGLFVHGAWAWWIFLAQIMQMPPEMLAWVWWWLIMALVLIQLSHWFFRLVSVVVAMGVLLVVAFWIIPTYPHTLDLQQWLSSRSIRIQVQRADDADELRDAQAQVAVYSGASIQTYQLDDLTGLSLDGIDTIAYLSTNAGLDTTVRIGLPDGAVLTLLPQSSISLMGEWVSDTGSLLGSWRRRVNQGKIGFTDRIQRPSVRDRSLSVTNQGVSCRDGIVSVSSTDTSIRCTGSRYAQQWVSEWSDSQTTTGQNGSGALPARVMASGWQIQLPAWIYISTDIGRTGMNQTWNQTWMDNWLVSISGVLIDQQQQRLQYRAQLDQWLDDSTQWTWTVSPMMEQPIRRKMQLLATRKPAEYSHQLRQFHLYQYIQWRYQGGIIDTWAVQVLDMRPQ